MTNKTKKERTGFSGWMTIPEWSSVRQVNVFGREREAEKAPRAEAPENLHVLVRGVIDLPMPGKISGTDASGNDCGTEDVAPDVHLGEEYELLVAADDHYQLWIDGVYQGQGPAASCPERCYYDRYSIVLPTEHLKQPPSDREMKSDPAADCKSGFYTVTIALHLYYHGRISRSWASGDGRFGVWVSVRRKESSASRLSGAAVPFQDAANGDCLPEKRPLAALGGYPVRRTRMPHGEGRSANPFRDAAHEDGLPDEPQKELAHCDESWRYQICTAYSGETAGYDTQFLENFDSRLWPEGWEQPGYNADNGYNIENGNNKRSGGEREDGAMAFGTNVRKPWGHLVPALWADYTMMPRPIRMLEEKVVYPRIRWGKVDKSTGLHPGRQICGEGSADEIKDGLKDEDEIKLKTEIKADICEMGRISGVFDFEQEITGAVLAEATGPSGAQVVICYGEELEETQKIACSFAEEMEETQYTEQPSDRQNGCTSNQLNVRWNMRCGCAYQEIWTLGEGVSVFHPYDYKGFRYVQLIYPETVKVHEVRAWVRHYPMEEDACTLKGVDSAGEIGTEDADTWNCVRKLQTEDEEVPAQPVQTHKPKADAVMTGLAQADDAGSHAEADPMDKMDSGAGGIVPEQEADSGITVTELERVSDSGITVTELEQIFEICKNAVRCCSQDGYLDCPTREKGQYLGDALITGRSQVWLTGSTELLRKCIDDFIASQSISPSMMTVAPGSVMQEIADFSLLFPLLPLTDYEFTGDKNYLACCYPAVKLLTESFLIYQRPDGLLENVGDLWNLVDWPENLRDRYDFPLTRPVVGEGCHNVINALWYGANQMQEQMERILGLPATGRTARIAPAYRAAFYREESCLFADSEISRHCSLHANLYAAYFGLLPKESEEAYLQLLQTPGRVCGALPAYFAMKSAARIGRPDICFRLMTRSDAYGWRNMLREGASASFEAWGKDQKWNTSLCHGWSSGFIPLFIEEIAGLHPEPAGTGKSESAAACKGCLPGESAAACKEHPAGRLAESCRKHPAGESAEPCRAHFTGEPAENCETYAPGSAWSEFEEPGYTCQTEGGLDGLRFSPPQIAGCPDFVLRVPWKGKTIRVVKHGGKIVCAMSDMA